MSLVSMSSFKGDDQLDMIERPRTKLSHIRSMLYPNMDQVHIKSPVMLFPKEKKPEDIFSVSSTKETIIKRPLMYQ